MRAPPGYCRLTVLTPGSRADVALPVDVPIADLVPMLMELLGEQGDPARPVPWRLTGPTGGAPAPGATLDDLGVLDGELLRLGPAAVPPPAPAFDDPVDALAALTAPADGGRPGRPGPRMIVPAVAVPVGALLLAGAGPPGHTWAAVVLAGTAALAAIAWAALAGRRAGLPTGRDGDPPTRATPVPAYCAVPLAAAAGWAALPGPPGAAPLLAATVAAGTAAALAQIAVRTVLPALVGAVVAAVLTAAAAVARLQFDVAVPVIAAVVAAAALCVEPVLPRLTLRLSGLPRPVVATDATGLVAADTGPDVLPAGELAIRARMARAQLAGLAGGCAVVAAAAAPLAATGAWAGPALAAAVTAVLLLRARGFADPAIVRVHLAAGSAAAAALVGLGAVAVGPAGRLGGALILLGAAAVTIATADVTATGSPVTRRAVELVEGVLAAAVVPLALAAAGVFALVRGL